jgi:hypothetical protein
MRKLLLLGVLALFATEVQAQTPQPVAKVVASCGNLLPQLVPGFAGTLTVDTSGRLCTARVSTTFTNLPTCNSAAEGTLATVTDSNTVTWGANVAGGGANRILAYCNAANWTVAAK